MGELLVSRRRLLLGAAGLALAAPKITRVSMFVPPPKRVVTGYDGYLTGERRVVPRGVVIPWRFDRDLGGYISLYTGKPPARASDPVDPRRLVATNRPLFS